MNKDEEYLNWKLTNFKLPINVYVLVISIMHAFFVFRDIHYSKSILSILIILFLRLFPSIYSLVLIFIKNNKITANIKFYLYNVPIFLIPIFTILTRFYYIPTNSIINYSYDLLVSTIATIFLLPKFIFINILPSVILFIFVGNKLNFITTDSLLSQTMIIPLITGIISIIFLLEKQFKKIHKDYVYYSNMAIFDNLTKVWNRNALFHEKILDEKGNFNISGTLAIINFDNFRKINYELGHEKGDAILKKFAEFVLNTIGENYIIRFDGDEFLIIFKEMYSPEIKLTLEKIQTHLNETLNCSASIGITTFEVGHKLSFCLKSAFSKVKESKNSGKNKIIY